MKKAEIFAVSTVVAAVWLVARWVRSWDFGESFQTLTND